MTLLKKEEEFCWLNDVSSVILQQTLRDLDKAFTNFFSKRAKYPKFKKKNSMQSVRYVNSAFTFSNGNLILAKHKEPLNIRWSRKFSQIPSSVTISKDPADRYFVSFAVEEPMQELPKKTKCIGIDIGIKDICVTSEGIKSGSPKYLRKYEKKLADRQRKMSKKIKGSKNRAKAKLKVARTHAKISDSRNDFNNKANKRKPNNSSRKLEC